MNKQQWLWFGLLVASGLYLTSCVTDRTDWVGITNYVHNEVAHTAQLGQKEVK